MKVPESTALTSVEKKTLLQEKTVNVNGRYYVPMLWEDRPKQLPAAYRSAFRRLVSTENQLKRQPGLLQKYNAGVQKDVQLGFIRKLSPGEVEALMAQQH